MVGANRVSSNHPVALGPKVVDRRQTARLARGARNGKVAVVVTGPLAVVAVAAAIAPAEEVVVVETVVPGAEAPETGVKADVPAAAAVSVPMVR